MIGYVFLNGGHWMHIVCLLHPIPNHFKVTLLYTHIKKVRSTESSNRVNSDRDTKRKQGKAKTQDEKQTTYNLGRGHKRKLIHEKGSR